MNQDSLFSSAQYAASAENVTVVRFYPSFESWRKVARAMLVGGVQPQACEWVPDFTAGVGASPEVAAQAVAPRIPKEFISVAKVAGCHRNDDRWALLYSIVWRLANDQPHLLQMRSDDQVARLYKYAASVNRDAHKMKAFVRFRCIEMQEAGAERYVAWFEPDHFIVEHVSGFFKRRFTNMRWSILTPQGCVHWEGEPSGQCWFSPACDKAEAPSQDEFEMFWQTYYRSIFNPARLKVSAMQSEMPQKYWHNLPEASVIGELIRSAGRSTSDMIDARKERDVLQCGPRPVRGSKAPIS